MNDSANGHNPESAGAQSDASIATTAFPSEAFPCPACGQMLAPSCRVCVACKQPINPAEITRLAAPFAPTFEARRAAVHPPPVRFSWPIFFVVFLCWFLLAGLAEKLFGLIGSQWIMGSVVILSSAWVFYDAHDKLVPKPLLWGLGSLLLWILMFPWYLARRRNPAAPCPFVEAEISPRTRLLLAALVIVVLLYFMLVASRQIGMATTIPART